MKIIISPAKTMCVDREAYEVKGLPRFLEETRTLMEAIKKLSFDEAKRLWKCSDKLTELNVQRFAEMDLEKALTPAVFSYEGLQYQNMGPGVFSCGAHTSERVCEYCPGFTASSGPLTAWSLTALKCRPSFL